MAETDVVELNEKARARLGDLRFVGELTRVDANARDLRLVETEHGAAAARDHIRVTALVDEDSRIRDIRFTSLATGIDLLTFELLMEWCINRKLDELPTGSPQALSRYLDEEGYDFPASQEGAGAPTQAYFILLKLSGRASHDQAPAKQEVSWQEAGLFEKVRRVEAALDEHVRPALASDGGGMEVVDLRPGDINTLLVEYQGACGSCSSALGGTMQFIEDTLEMQLGVPFKLDVQAADEGFFGL
jgi:Fe-S cluster biogenesis protein NfuA/NifU-like protein involved in Fe-S cluster formation